MDISGQFVALVPITMALVEAIKAAGLPTRLSPILALVVGAVGACALAGGVELTAIIEGIVAGLTASGLYSGGKTVIK